MIWIYKLQRIQNSKKPTRVLNTSYNSKSQIIKNINLEVNNLLNNIEVKKDATDINQIEKMYEEEMFK